MWAELHEHLWHFVEEFIGKPDVYWWQFTLPYIARSVAIHFLSSACLGYAGYWWMRTILSRRPRTWPDRCIFPISLLFGCAMSATTHIVIDGFTTLA